MSEFEEKSPRKRNRAKRWVEAIKVTLEQGATARMDAVLQDGEDRLDLIRGAIDKEVTRREKQARRHTTSEP